MRFRVGGEIYELTRDQVLDAMRGIPSEMIQKHLVEVNGQTFPPKQVFATVTGRARQTFTTMEAQRVLSKLGFFCTRTNEEEPNPHATATPVGSEQDSCVARLTSVEAAMATAQVAIAGLHTRLKTLEGAS